VVSINKHSTKSKSWEKYMMTFALTQPVSLVCTKRPIPFIRWLVTNFGAVEYEKQIIEIPNAGFYQVIMSSDNSVLEVGVQAPIDEIVIGEMENSGAQLLRREGNDAIFEILHGGETVGLVRLSAVPTLVPR
jgi:hypothetical protein